MGNSLKEILEYKGTYYVHLFNIDIGYRDKANIDMTKVFKQKHSEVRTEMKNRYKALMRARINQNSLDTYDNIVQLKGDSFFDVFNENLEKKMQQQVSIDKLGKLYEYGNSIKPYLKKAVNKKSLKSFNAIIEGIGRAVQLMQTDAHLGSLLVDFARNNKARSRKKLGAALEAMLNKYSNENQGIIMSNQVLSNTVSQLKNLAHVLKTGTFNTSNTELTAKGLSTLVLGGIISTALGQGLGFMATQKISNLTNQVGAELVGTKRVTNRRGVKISGKTDVKFNNVQVLLSAIDKGATSGAIVLDIGISEKFYLNQAFLNSEERGKNTFSPGSGPILGQTLTSIFGEPIQRYYVYNYMTHGIYQEQLNDLIAVKQLLNFFATADNQVDFSQFLLLNGRIVSMWTLVKYAFQNSLSLSQSMMKNNPNSNQAIAISIPDRPEFAKANVKIDESRDSYFMGWKRSKIVNARINAAKISAYLHLDKLMRSYEQSKQFNTAAE